MVRHAHHPHIDDHPAAMFGLMIGTLAVLMTVLVFFIYARAQQASTRLGPSVTHSIPQR